jgi:hypothetical protein
MTENLLQVGSASASYSGWVPTVTGSGTVPVGTYSATSGPDSQPGVTLSCTGTSGGIQGLATVLVAPQTMIGVSVTCKASSASPTLVPITVVFLDAAGNTIATDTPVASAAAPTSFTKYNAVLGVPDGAVKASVSLAWLAWTTTGAYTVIMSSPMVVGF